MVRTCLPLGRRERKKKNGLLPVVAGCDETGAFLLNFIHLGGLENEADVFHCDEEKMVLTSVLATSSGALHI